MFLIHLLLTLAAGSVSMAPLQATVPGDGSSVPAALGGNGFEKIAADSGWESGTLAADDYRYFADTNALKGGTIAIAIDEWPATFRAYGKDENTQETRMIYDLVYESLLQKDPLKAGFLPSLATHWRVDTARQTYFFRIDPDARFSDGHPVTSADVIATYDLGVDPHILSPATNAFFEGFARPVAVSPYIVSVRSKSRNWKDLLYISGMVILPAHVIGRISGKDYLIRYQYDMPAGSGPYIVRREDVIAGRSVRLGRRADWWGLAKPLNRGRYNFDSIRLAVVRDESLGREKFTKGEFDFYKVTRAQSWVEDFAIDEVRRGLIIRQKVYTRAAAGFSGIAFNTRRAPFDDIGIRKAIGMLFDRKQIVEKLMFNQYDLTNSIYPGTEYENQASPRHEYNPAGAAALLAAAGYTSRNSKGILVRNGKPLEIEMLIYAEQQRFLAPVQQDLAQAGILVTFRTLDQTTWFTLLKQGEYQMAFMGWGGLQYPNPVTSFHSNLLEMAYSNNITGFADPRADRIIEREQVSYDPRERTRLLQQLDSIITASYHYAFSWHMPYQRLLYWNRFGTPEFVLGRTGDWTDLLSLWWVDPEKEEQLAAARRDVARTIEHPPEESRFWETWRR